MPKKDYYELVSEFSKRFPEFEPIYTTSDPQFPRNGMGMQMSGKTIVIQSFQWQLSTARNDYTISFQPTVLNLTVLLIRHKIQTNPFKMVGKSGSRFTHQPDEPLVHLYSGLY